MATSTPIEVRRDRTKRPKLGGDIVTVLVGPEATATKFYIHSDLASQHSEFFNAALKKGWKEAEERIVHLPELPEHTGDMFEDFHSFLYTGKVYSGHESEVNEPGFDKEWARLKYSWVLGEVLLSTAYKDAVVDAIIHKILVTRSHPTTMYETIYSYGSEASTIRKLMVDMAIHEWQEEQISKVDTDDNPALQAKFLQDVAVALLKANGLSKKEQANNPITLESGCLYHEHGADKACYKIMFG